MFYKLPISIVSFAVGGMDGANHIVRRGTESPSNDELRWNTVGFAIPAVLAFGLRM